MAFLDPNRQPPTRANKRDFSSGRPEQIVRKSFTHVYSDLLSDVETLSEEELGVIESLLDIPAITGTEVEVISWADGTPISKRLLEPSVFGVPLRRDVIHDVIRWQLARRRSGNAKVGAVAPSDTRTLNSSTVHMSSYDSPTSDRERVDVRLHYSANVPVSISCGLAVLSSSAFLVACLRDLTRVLSYVRKWHHDVTVCATESCEPYIHHYALAASRVQYFSCNSIH